MSAMIAPLIITSVALYAYLHRVDVFSAMLEGAENGLRTVLEMLPILITLLTAVYMLRASGALEFLGKFCAPVLEVLGIPPETAALVFLRPVTGSGSIAVASEIISSYGADSLIGRTAAVMLGATETTFYVVAVYFGAAGVTRLRHAVPSALIADLTGFIVAAFCVRLFWG